MDPNFIPDPVKASVNRIIEGESEPEDASLVAELLRTCESHRTQLRQQLEMDALLRLEAEPTAEGFVEAVIARTTGAVDEESFLRRVREALPGSCAPPRGAPVRSGWMQWRPLTAAVTGLVVGMLCTSMVFAYAAPYFGKVTTLLREGFEGGFVPAFTGPPREMGKWSGDFAEIVGAQNGVAPHSGTKMWRFLRADSMENAEVRGSYVGEAIYAIDLKPLRQAGEKPGRQIEISAWFAAGQIAPDHRYHWNIKAAAFEGSVKEAPELWTQWDRASTSLAQREVPAGEPGLWQRVSVTMLLPTNADYLVFECVVVQKQPSVKDGVAQFPAHYLDDVQIRILPSTRDADADN